MDAVLEEFFPQIVRRNDFQRDMAAVSGIARALISAMFLGAQPISQLGDLATVVLAGGRIMTGFKSVFTRTPAKAIKELRAAGQDRAALILQGVEIENGSRIRTFLDTDDPNRVIPDRWLEKVSQKASNLVMLEMQITGATYMTKKLARSFRFDMIGQMGKDLADFDGLSKRLQTMYLRNGIDANDAKRLSKLLNEKGVDAVDGRLRVPDEKRWADADLDKYWQAVEELGNDAILTAGYGDGAIWFRGPLGRMFGQFTRFAFVAQERFIGQLVQRGITDPKDVAVPLAIFSAFALGILSDGMRALVRGPEKFEEWQETWDSAQGRRDRIVAGLTRSPLMGGFSANIVDHMTGQFGRTANDLAEPHFGRIFPEEATRFRERQGAFGVAGPALGFGLGTLPSLARTAVEDPGKALDSAQRSVPAINAWWFQLIENSMRDDKR